MRASAQRIAPFYVACSAHKAHIHFIKMKANMASFDALLLVILSLSLGCDSGTTTMSPTSNDAGTRTDVHLTDVTAEAGLSSFKHDAGVAGKKWMPETMGAGGGFVDYDGDGVLDIVLVGGGSLERVVETMSGTPALRLYKNMGNGSYRDVTHDVGLGNAWGHGMGITAADYDNDGDDDLFLTVVGKDMLFRNDSGTFVEVADQAGVAGPESWSTAAIFFDAERDGYVDLFVGSYVEWTPETDLWCSLDGETKSYCTPRIYEEASSRFYRNNRDGTFTEAFQAAGMGSTVGNVLGVAEDDFNRDGWPDLVVARDLERTLYYANNGDGTFREKGLATGIAFDPRGIARAGMGIDTGIVDSSEGLTVFIGNFSHEMVGVYHYTSDGYFVDRAAASQIGMATMNTLTFGLVLVDIDLDSHLDLFLANGHVQPLIEKTQGPITYRQVPQLFLNRGDGTFERSPPRGVLGADLVARGVAVADYDGDGDSDLLITENDGPVHLWRNDAAAGNFMRVGLCGTDSHPTGIGSRVVAFIGDRRIERKIRTGSSYLSHSEQVASFGFGSDVSTIDSLHVHWSSGKIDRFGSIDVNQAMLVREGSSKWLAR